MSPASRTFSRFLTLILVVLATSASARAQGISYRGWGPRVGVSHEPDQVFIGVHLHLGEIVHKLRFQPNLEIGFGDDVTLIATNFGVLWFFPVSGEWKPYAGGELGLVFQDFDREPRPGRGDDDDTDISFNAVAGIETLLKENRRFLVEIKLGLIEEPDLKVLVGWTF